MALGLACVPGLPHWLAPFFCPALFLAGWYRLARDAGRSSTVPPSPGSVFRTALLFFCCGFCLGTWRGQDLSRRCEDRGFAKLATCRVEGVVREETGPREGAGSASMVLERVSVFDYGGHGASFLFQGMLKVSYDASAGRFAPGDRLSFNGSLRPLHPPSNPGEFDYRRYLLEHGIKGLASPRFGQAPRLMESGGSWNWRRWIWRWREKVGQSLDSGLPALDAALVKGMLLGDKTGLPKEELESFSRSGLSYLLAVAGLHLALFLAIGAKSIGWFVRGRKKQAMAALVLMISYAAVSGFQVPVIRAGAMFLLLLTARMADLETDFTTSFSFGALLVLCLQPGALAEPGFQFSFGTTAAIVVMARPLGSLWEEAFLAPRPAAGQPGAVARFAAELLGLAVAAQIAVLPVQAWHFFRFTWPALFSNLCAAPLLPAVIALGLLTAFTAALWHPLAWLPALMLRAVLAVLSCLNHFFAGLPGSCLSVGRPSFLWTLGWALAAVSLAWSLSRKSSAGLRACGLAFTGLLFILLLPTLPHRHPGHTKVWFFDVGQGDAILCEFEDGRTLLVDGGPALPDAGSWVIDPALRRLGISSLDWVALTHPHADHLGGLIWVFKQFPVGAVLDAGEFPSSPVDPRARPGEPSLWQRFQEALRMTGHPSLACRAGGPVPPGLEAHATVLAPMRPPISGSRHDLHNNNLVLRVGEWLWLGGDMEKQGEARLVREGSGSPVRVLKLGHHGSSTSTSPALLDALRPEYAVAQCGRDNRFGFPKPDVCRRLEGKVRLLRTDLHGCIFMDQGPGGLVVETFLSPPQDSIFRSPPKPKRSVWKNLEKHGLLR